MLPAMDMVHNLARRAVPTEEDAKDLVQDTYLAAFKAWSEHRRPRQGRTVARDDLPQPGPRPLPQPHPASPGGLPVRRAGSDDWRTGRGPEERALSAVDGAAVHRALWTLPEEQRVAIALVDLADLSIMDAADVMGTPKGTVLSRLHRGRRALASLLGAEVNEVEP